MKDIYSKSGQSAVEITGVVDKILWCSDDASRVIARLYAGDVVCGDVHDGELCPSVAYRFFGSWRNNPRYGDQFNFSTYIKDTPLDPNGVIKYLSDECPGVGRRKAAQLWEAFGNTTLETARTNPEAIAATGILTHEQSLQAAETLASLAAVERTKIDLFGMFAGRGFHGTLVGTCMKRWGARAPQIIRRNPFVLLTAELASAGFKRCDKLYCDLGLPKHRLKRQMLCLWNAMRCDGEGHTWHLASRVVRCVTDEIGNKARPVLAARLGRRAKWLASWRDNQDQVWLAEAAKARDEWRLSEKIRELLACNHAEWPLDFLEGVTEHQREKVGQSLVKCVGILAGTPGTGKTFSAGSVIKRLCGTVGREQIGVCAPTGKAAVRVMAAMRQYGIDLHASTIHRMLGINRNGHDGKGWGFTFNADNPLPFKYLVVDEVSMLDTGLAADLMAACSPGTHVLLIGDPYQLPPVGHGAPLRDMIAAGVPCGELSEIKRNAGLIVHACAKMKDGKPFETTNQIDEKAGLNLRHVETDSPEETINSLLTILRRFKHKDRYDPVWECQALIAVNAKSKLSRMAINTLLQNELNPSGGRVPGNPFRLNDKIICLKNSVMMTVELDGECTLDGQTLDPAQPVNYREIQQEFVANGEIGRVVAVAPKVTIAHFPLPDRTVKILHGKVKEGKDGKKTKGINEQPEDGEQSNGNEVEQESSSLVGCNFDLAYACTCHKLQGSEARVVFVLIDDYTGARRITSREFYYTAISRAKDLCITIGKMAVLNQCCKKIALGKRKTFLKELLEGSK